MLALGAEGNVRAKLDGILRLGPFANTVAGSYGLLDVADNSHVVPSLAAGSYGVNASFWGQEQVLFGANFLNNITGQFLAELHEVDFKQTSAQVAIRDWQNATTGGYLFGNADIDTETQLVITNTDYLSSTWPTNTGVAREILGVFQESRLILFEQLDGSFDVVQTEEYQAFRLPLAAGKEMVFVMPTSGLFAQIAAGLDATWVSALFSAMTTESITLFVPEFKTSSSIDLKQYLMDGGVPEVFDSGNASFSAMSSEASFYPNVLVHEAEIGISDQGVEAGSLNLVSFKKPVPPDSSAGFIVTQYGPTTCPTWNLAQNEFVLDRPFLFLIRDNRTSVLLYMGQFHDPDGNPPVCLSPPVEYVPAMPGEG